MKGYKISILLSLLFLLSSCGVRKYLREDEIMLKSNKIEIEGNKTIENKFQLSEQINTLFKQKPNTNFLLIIPREWLYFKYKDKKSGFAKTMTERSQPPALLDSSLCNATKDNITNFLFSQGYFNANCYYDIKIKNKYAYVTYHINPDERYYINNIQFIAEDPAVQALIDDNLDASFLKPGAPVDNSLFQNEKARISEIMFNHGYVEFNPVYIQTPEIDTIHLKANVKIVINNPDGKSAHSQYKVHSIQVNPFYFPNDSLDYEDQIYDSITIKTLPYYKFVKSKTIASKVRFRPGMVTNKSLIDETYNQLNKLGIYRFVNIESKIDSVYKDEINYTILLNPLKKWVFDFGADFNYTSIKTVGKTLFGISGFVNLKNRNLFKGAESFSTKIEVGTELDFFSANKFNSLSIHYGNELSLPEFYDITGTFRLIKFISKPFTSIISKPDSRTNFKIGVDFEQLSDFYNYISLNSNIEYEWQIKRRKRISLRTFGFSFYVPHTTTKFDTAYLDKNQYLKNSFTGKRLFTSFFLDNVTYYYQSRILNNKQHAYIGSFNISGLEVYSVNKLYNAINGSDEAFSLGPFEFSNFVKTESDYRFYLTFSDKSKLVCRMDAGIAVPYGNSTSVPFIKQFYSGGPQSIRGWNIRELGPGSIHDESTDLRAYYAAGDIKLEANVEYRFDIFWRFKGALFLEAGNIWLLPRVESTDKRGEFSNQFYNDIAIGTGFGVRFDLSYFLFRVDVGFKLRSNYEQDDTKSHWLYSEKKPVSVKRLFENSTIHIALDYPF